MQILFDHLKAGMSENGLQAVNVAAVLQVPSGEGMPQEVRMQTGDPGAFFELAKEIFHRVGGELLAVSLTNQV